MHDTAYEIGRLFFRNYVNAGDVILDIGSMDINGSLRDFRPEGSLYVGVDLSRGNGVNLVVKTNSHLPFSEEIFNVVVSTSCFEHDAMFWLTFLEMCRVLKSGGFVYLNAPSKGAYHQYPIDAWRFFPDAGIALRDWARLNKHGIELVESFVTENRGDMWNDCVMIFGKTPDRAPLPISEQYQLAFNVRSQLNLEYIQARRDQW